MARARQGSSGRRPAPPTRCPLAPGRTGTRCSTGCRHRTKRTPGYASDWAATGSTLPRPSVNAVQRLVGRPGRSGIARTRVASRPASIAGQSSSTYVTCVNAPVSGVSVQIVRRAPSHRRARAAGHPVRPLPFPWSGRHWDVVFRTGAIDDHHTAIGSRGPRCRTGRRSRSPPPASHIEPAHRGRAPTSPVSVAMVASKGAARIDQVGPSCCENSRYPVGVSCVPPGDELAECPVGITYGHLAFALRHQRHEQAPVRQSDGAADPRARPEEIVSTGPPLADTDRMASW